MVNNIRYFFTFIRQKPGLTAGAFRRIIAAWQHEKNPQKATTPKNKNTEDSGVSSG
jgi:hypothetical protein